MCKFLPAWLKCKKKEANSKSKNSDDRKESDQESGNKNVEVFDSKKFKQQNEKMSHFSKPDLSQEAIYKLRMMRDGSKMVESEECKHGESSSWSKSMICEGNKLQQQNQSKNQTPSDCQNLLLTICSREENKEKISNSELNKQVKQPLVAQDFKAVSEHPHLKNFSTTKLPLRNISENLRLDERTIIAGQRDNNVVHVQLSDVTGDGTALAQKRAVSENVPAPNLQRQNFTEDQVKIYSNSVPLASCTNGLSDPVPLPSEKPSKEEDKKDQLVDSHLHPKASKAVEESKKATNESNYGDYRGSTKRLVEILNKQQEVISSLVQILEMRCPDVDTKEVLKGLQDIKGEEESEIGEDD
jgi:hypothetical protein